MSDLKFRPRFRLEVDLPESEVAHIVKKKLLDNNPDRFLGTIVEGHLVLKINQQYRHFWSPQMDISLSPMEEGGTLIRCLLAPQPSVWTMFMFFYSVSGFGAFIGLMIAMSQYTLERDMWGLWLALACTVLGGILFLVAQFGKGLAKDEMVKMKNFLTEINWS